MKAVLLIGGEGTRLRPLTCNIAKCMVPVLNRPLLEHIINYLKKHRIFEIILTLSYLPDTVKNYFKDGSDFGVKLIYSLEEAPLGTAGAIKNVEKYLDDTFVVLNGDVYTAIDLTGMSRQHRKMKAKASIALTPVENPTIYGVVECDAGCRVSRFLEKPKAEEITTNLINAGIYILDPSVLNYIPAASRCMFEYDLFPLLLKRQEVFAGYTSDAYWIDVGTPQKYFQLNCDLINNLVAGGRKRNRKILLGERCQISRSAKITGVAVIGNNCSVGDYSVIEQSILWDNVKIGSGVSIKDSIIASDCTIGDRSVLDNVILGDHVELKEWTNLKPGSSITSGSCLDSIHR